MLGSLIFAKSRRELSCLSDFPVGRSLVLCERIAAGIPIKGQVKKSFIKIVLGLKLQTKYADILYINEN